MARPKISGFTFLGRVRVRLDIHNIESSDMSLGSNQNWVVNCEHTLRYLIIANPHLKAQ